MSTSQELPEVSTWLNDMPRTTACASAMPSAPDWLTIPMACFPGGGIGVMSMNVTRMSSGAFTTPMQFGPTYPVNARYERIGDQPCYPDVAALPEVPDCAVVTAPREAVEDIVVECARAGIGGVVIFASGYSETGRDDRIAQQHRLTAMARESNMRIDSTTMSSTASRGAVTTAQSGTSGNAATFG